MTKRRILTPRVKLARELQRERKSYIAGSEDFIPDELSMGYLHNQTRDELLAIMTARNWLHRSAVDKLRVSFHNLCVYMLRYQHEDQREAYVIELSGKTTLQLMSMCENVHGLNSYNTNRQRMMEYLAAIQFDEIIPDPRE